jgi:hypothetical protein
MKFSRSPFVIDKKYAKELRSKLDILSNQSTFKNKILFLTMVTCAGVKENVYSIELLQNEVKLTDLFKPY